MCAYYHTIEISDDDTRVVGRPRPPRKAKESEGKPSETRDLDQHSGPVCFHIWRLYLGTACFRDGRVMINLSWVWNGKMYSESHGLEKLLMEWISYEQIFCSYLPKKLKCIMHMLTGDVTQQKRFLMDCLFQWQEQPIKIMDSCSLNKKLTDLRAIDMATSPSITRVVLTV